MARSISPTRFGQLIDVATQTFVKRGYRQTQIADIADALGVAKGTLYGYVESKDALFDAAIRYADRPSDLPGPDALPVRTPAPGATIEYVRNRLAAGTGDIKLVRVVRGKLTIDDPAQELEVILKDLYQRLADNRYTLKLIDRCAADYPELAAVWFASGRWKQHKLLVQLINKRIAEGSYRVCDNVEVLARTVLEVIAFWALHRHFDPSPQLVDDLSAQHVVIDLLSRALLQMGA